MSKNTLFPLIFIKDAFVTKTLKSVVSSLLATVDFKSATLENGVWGGPIKFIRIRRYGTQDSRYFENFCWRNLHINIQRVAIQIAIDKWPQYSDELGFEPLYPFKRFNIQ